jgi:hypothetical protein
MTLPRRAVQRQIEFGILPIHSECAEPTRGHWLSAEQLWTSLDLATEGLLVGIEYIQLASFPYRDVTKTAVIAPFQVSYNTAARTACGSTSPRVGVAVCCRCRRTCSFSCQRSDR